MYWTVASKLTNSKSRCAIMFISDYYLKSTHLTRALKGNELPSNKCPGYDSKPSDYGVLHLDFVE